MTKEQIQQRYSTLCSQLGEKLYRLDKMTKEAEALKAQISKVEMLWAESGYDKPQPNQEVTDGSVPSDQGE